LFRDPLQYLLRLRKNRVGGAKPNAIEQLIRG
jgi:hypothetical protein